MISVLTVTFHLSNSLESRVTGATSNSPKKRKSSSKEESVETQDYKEEQTVDIHKVCHCETDIL
jgi:cation transport ATPase